MTKHRDFADNQILPAAWLDVLEEYLSTQTANFKLEKATADPATAVKVTAGPGNDKVALGIMGKWRVVEATVTSPNFGPAASGTYNIYATSVAQSNAAEDALTQDYSFALEIRTSGTPSAALYRKVGEAIWDGTRITSINQTVPGVGAGAATITSVARSTSTTIGNGSATTFPITHNFGTRQVFVKVFNDTTYEEVEAEVISTDINTVTINTTAVPTSNQYRVVVAAIGEGASPIGGGQGSYSALIGDGSTLNFDITHNLGTRDVAVVVRRTAGPYDEVQVRKEYTSLNQVRLEFSTAPAASEYTVSIIGGGGGNAVAAAPAAHSANHRAGGSDSLATTDPYTTTNVTTDRAFDADTVAVAELADVVGTLIADLRAAGLIPT